MQHLGSQIARQIDGAIRHQLRVLGDGAKQVELRPQHEQRRRVTRDMIDDGPDDAPWPEATEAARGPFQPRFEVAHAAAREAADDDHFRAQRAHELTVKLAFARGLPAIHAAFHDDDVGVRD